MSKTQKLIKLFAIFLAIIIIINIFSLLIYSISLIPGIDINTNKGLTFEEEYNNIEKIEIDITSASIIIKEGNELKITTINMENNFNSKLKNKTLILEEKTKLFSKKNTNGTLTITIPNDYILDELNADTGAGTVTIDNVEINEVELDHGAGQIKINNSFFHESDINGGAGEIKITNSKLNNLDLDAGIGKVKIESLLTGYNQIDCGIGEIELTLTGKEEDYQLNLEKGIGNIKIKNNKQKNSILYGNGSNKIKVEGGIGNININFK